MRIVLAVLVLVPMTVGVVVDDREGALSLLDRPTALTTWWAMDAIGLPASVDGTTLTHPDGFGIRIEYVCTILIPAALIAAFLLLLPVSPTRSLTGIVVATALLTVLNAVRLIGLYWIGVCAPAYFSFSHDWIGQGLLATFMFAFVAWWTRRPG